MTREFGALLHNLREEMDRKWDSLERGRLERRQRKDLMNEEIVQWKSIVGSIERDIITILRNYKDMLNEIFKLQLMSEDIK